MDKIGVGLIGCGAVSSRHFEAIKQIENFELKAVCDVDKTSAEKNGRLYGADYYTSVKKLLDRNDISLVSICTPIFTHTGIAMQALRAGKHVLTEKPVGLTLKAIDKLIDVGKKTGKKIFVVHQVRYSASIYALKHAIDSGMLGNILACNLVVRWFRPENYFTDKWYGKKNLAGGTLLNQGIHYIDIMQWLAGDIKTVIGLTDNLRYPKLDIEDYISALVFFKHGAVGQIEINILTYDKNYECSFTVMGSKGTVKLSGKALQSIEYWNVEGYEKPLIPDGLPNYIKTKGFDPTALPTHEDVYRDVIFNLRQGDSNSNTVDAVEARKSVALALAIYKSSEKDCRKIDLEA